MKLTWATDIHLNFIWDFEKKSWKNFISPGLTDLRPIDVFKDLDGDAFIISGDIAESDSFGPLLKELHEIVKKPIYFILGNHDYYGGSFHLAHQEASNLDGPDLIHLRKHNFIALTDQVGLVGQEGLYDVRLGAAQRSNLQMNDFYHIKELSEVNYQKSTLIKKIQELADLEAKMALAKLRLAALEFSTVYFATHYPPFAGATWHQGSISDSTWLPYFSSKAMGGVLEIVAGEFPKTKFIVLCGHTHSSGIYKFGENLTVWTGISDYGRPQISKTWEV